MSSLFFVVFFLPLFWPVRKSVTFHAVLHHRNHTQVFRHLANVAALRDLNPTITEITRWEMMNETDFYVEYSECLSQVPAIGNKARAFYRIQDGGEGSHSLTSRHSTCFLGDFLCLATDSRLDITKLSDSEVGYRENIVYSCPWALSTFCFHEVATQRQLIVSNLKEIFESSNNITSN